MLRTSPLSLIQVVVEELIKRRVKTAGVVASPTSVRTRLFERALQDTGIETLQPSIRFQNAVEVSIRNVIAGLPPDDEVAVLSEISHELQRQGAQNVILGCTELSVIAKNAQLLQTIDPFELVTKIILHEVE